MTDRQTQGATDSAHGVHGASREDGAAQEEPGSPAAQDEEAWAEATETGGDATS
jgi:hypothetical protein